MFYEEDRSSIEDYIYKNDCINLNWPTHFHNSYELFCVMKGESCLNIENKTYTVKANEIAFIAPNQVHSWETTKYTKSFVLIFSENYIKSFHQQYADKIPENPIIDMPFLGQMHDAIINTTDKYHLKSILYYVVSLLNQGTHFIERKNACSVFIHDTILYIQKNFKETITLQTLSAYLGYGYSYTSSLISQSFHKSFSELVCEYRVSLAMDLLSNTDLPISDISLACGFNSIRSFNRNFSKQMGLTPSEIRSSGDLLHPSNLQRNMNSCE